MAQVYRAMDTRLVRPVALKVLSVEQAADPETRLRFYNEAQSAAQLDHENIARVYYIGEDRGRPFIVSEFIEGTDIRGLVERRGGLPLAEVVSYTLQVAEALAHAASRNIVHRDIKPSNVLVTPQGQAKVIDMGLARIQDPRQRGSDLTASGVTLGTFDYISPEQARDPRNADVRSDIYSLGCAFFYMLAGRPPFPEGTVLQKLLQHQGDEPPDLRQFRPGLPDNVLRVLRQMLAKDPRRRYQNASELVEDLLALAEQLGLRPIGHGRTIWVAPRQPRWAFIERHLPWIAPIAALVCIVMLLDYLWSSPAAPGNRYTASEPLEVSRSAPLEDRKAAPEDTKPASGDLPDEPSPQPPSPSASKPAPSVEGPREVKSPSGVTDDRAKPAVAPSVAPKTNPVAEPVGPSPSSGVSGSPLEGGGLGPEALDARLLANEPMASGLTLANKTASPADSETNPLAGSVPKTPSVSKPPQTGVLVVSDRGNGPGEFATLAAACSAARSGDVIELRYDGRLPRLETPIRLTNLRLTIRAAAGCRPVLAFRPSLQDRDPVKYPRSMFRVTGGELAVYNVALELDVPREIPAETWSLFEPGHGQTVRLNNCVMTIRNASDEQTPFHPDVAFFRVKAPPGTDMVTADEAVAAPPVVLELADCVARGEAVFVRAEDAQPVRLTWENGLLATTGQLLVAPGGQRYPLPDEKIEIRLSHLTAATGGGLCRLSASEMAPHQLNTEIHVSDSIVLIPAKGVLIEHSGLDTAEGLKRQFHWSGDWNFYQGFTVFWSIQSDNPKTPPELLTLDAWQAHWGPQRENMPKWGRVVWKQLPEVGRAIHTRTPSDYALAESDTGNPARHGARDGRDVGFQPELLPPIPADVPGPQPAKSSTVPAR